MISQHQEPNQHGTHSFECWIIIYAVLPLPTDILLIDSPPPTLYFCFAKIVRMFVGEYEQRAVYTRCNVVSYGPDNVLETVLISKTTAFSMAVMNLIFAHDRIVPVIATAIEHIYLVQGTP